MNQHDDFNLDCSSMRSLGDSDLRLRGLMNEQRERIGLPPIPIYPAHEDSGQRLRRTDKVSESMNKANDPVNQPAHYTGHPSGVECIQVTEHMGFNLGNAVKYIWRCDLKLDAIEDLEKASWYIKREIEKRKKAAA
jgi:hypothetical protein